jgi:hypothetical protein
MNSTRICGCSCRSGGVGAAAGRLLADASWTVVHAGGDVVEIDRASIRKDSIPASRAWSRVRLEREVRDAGGNYDSIRAENLYDCAQRVSPPCVAPISSRAEGWYARKKSRAVAPIRCKPAASMSAC